MSGLAKYLLSLGKYVAGSDIVESDYTRELRDSGVEINIGIPKASVLNYDTVVYTDAVRDDDIQLCEARKLGKEIISRGQLLYEISRSFQMVIAVSGCHGKTTCTAMLAHIFRAAGTDFCVHMGGRDLSFSNTYVCGKKYFICEACEYKKNFLLLRPDIAVILNSGADHLECYGSIENLKAAYVQFASGAEVAVIKSGDLNVSGITFGTDKKSDYRATNLVETRGMYAFTVYESGTELGKISLKVFGKHNVWNAIAAVAAARRAGISFRYIRWGLEEFSGVERRFERIGYFQEADCIADYAHHPDEIRATFRTAKKVAHGKVFVIFQPHTYSRTKNLFQDFTAVLSSMPNLLIYRTFAAREYFDDAGSALRLSQAVKKSRYGDDVRDIRDFLKQAKKGDTILFLGAGDIYEIAKFLVRNPE